MGGQPRIQVAMRRLGWNPSIGKLTKLGFHPSLRPNNNYSPGW